MFECIKKWFSKKEITPTPDVPVTPIEHNPDVEPIRPLNLEPGLRLIKEFEGCVLRAYPDPGTGGAPWTIGWGHTGPDVFPGKTISQAEADALFEQDIQPRVEAVKSLIKKAYTDNQFCALLSFAYNCGIGALGSSRLLYYFNQGQTQMAADEFPKWNQAAGRVLPGLVRRRARERELFLS